MTYCTGNLSRKKDTAPCGTLIQEKLKAAQANSSVAGTETAVENFTPAAVDSVIKASSENGIVPTAPASPSPSKTSFRTEKLAETLAAVAVE